MQIDALGWVSDCEHIPSPNYDDRGGAPIDLLVIHNISLPPNEFGGAGVQQLFTNTLDAQAHPYYAKIAGVKVSAHFFVRRTGHVVQFVSCLHRAWHAGESVWQGRTRCNDYSIGIELEGADDVPFTLTQYDALQKLTRVLRVQFPLGGIAGHSDIAPLRKTDPGPCFDWLRYLTGIS